LFAGLLALAGVLGVGESHLLHRATRRVGSGYFAKSGSLLQSVLRLSLARTIATKRRGNDAHNLKIPME
ncbi:hypothetical protein V3413_25935, partial [Pseudomonas aeruginosa]|uniref:hypothetical protein n=1 Tax=Pseudomonas aeruginosa TaxID=287 RepID=UPI0030030C02